MVRSEYRIDGSCRVTVQVDDTDDGWAAKPGIHTRTCADVRIVQTSHGCTHLTEVGCPE
jgi:hypothetical protein